MKALVHKNSNIATLVGSSALIQSLTLMLSIYDVVDVESIGTTVFSNIESSLGTCSITCASVLKKGEIKSSHYIPKSGFLHDENGTELTENQMINILEENVSKLV